MTGAMTPEGYRDWSSPTAMEDWLADCEAERAVTAATGRTAMERAGDAMPALAQAVVGDILTDRLAKAAREPNFRRGVLAGFGLAEVTPEAIPDLRGLLEAELDQPSRAALGFSRALDLRTAIELAKREGVALVTALRKIAAGEDAAVMREIAAAALAAHQEGCAA